MRSGSKTCFVPTVCGTGRPRGCARRDPIESGRVGVHDDPVFTLEGHSIDLDVLYREMYGYAVLIDGERVVDVPVTDKLHPVNHAIRSECRDRLDTLGWAAKGPGRSPRYSLHREL